MKNEKTSVCTWAIPSFPRKIKARFAGMCRANGVRIRDRLEYIITKDVRDGGFIVHPFEKEEKK